MRGRVRGADAITSRRAHNLVVHRALGKTTSLEKEHNAASLTQQRCFCEPKELSSLCEPAAIPLLRQYCVVLDMYVPYTALAREYAARGVCGGGTLRLYELWRGPCTPPRYLNPYVNEREPNYTSDAPRRTSLQPYTDQEKARCVPRGMQHLPPPCSPETTGEAPHAALTCPTPPTGPI